MTDRLTTTEGLNVGDVVTVAVELRNKNEPGTYWWKRFAVVTTLPFATNYVELLSLKMHPTEDDVRLVDLDRDVVHLLPEEQWPQGVIAMRMKAVHMGWLKLDG